MRTAAYVICCFLAGCLLAACTTPPSFKPDTSVTKPAVGRPAPPSSVQAANSSAAFTPYSQLGEADDDGLAPNDSTSALSKACLTDAGFPNANDFIGVAISFGGLNGDVPWGQWGYLGVAEAQQYGFTLRAFRFRSLPAAQASGPPSAAEQKAESKCATITSKFTQSQFSGSLAGIMTLTNDIQTDVQHDPSVKAATKAWSACMATSGYNITDPMTALGQAFRGGYVVGGGGAIAIGGTQNKAQQEAQKALAVTDADCTSSTDLAGIYFAVRASYEQQLVNANQQALNAAVVEYRDAYRTELSKLPKLLSATKS